LTGIGQRKGKGLGLYEEGVSWRYEGEENPRARKSAVGGGVNGKEDSCDRKRGAGKKPTATKIWAIFLATERE